MAWLAAAWRLQRRIWRGGFIYEKACRLCWRLCWPGAAWRIGVTANLYSAAWRRHLAYGGNGGWRVVQWSNLVNIHLVTLTISWRINDEIWYFSEKTISIQSMANINEILSVLFSVFSMQWLNLWYSMARLTMAKWNINSAYSSVIS